VTRVLVTRTGGFAGLRRTGEVETDDLPTDLAARWHQAMGELAALAVGAPQEPGPGADRFSWLVQFEQTSVVVGEARLSDDVRTLLEQAVAGGDC
jgi:hypothetical protein